MSLYSPAEQKANVPNGGSRSMTGGIGTINPAALSGGGVLIPQTNVDPSPRGTKRSRSPDEYGHYAQGDEQVAGEAKPRKRGRPAKTPRTSGDYTNDHSGALPTPSSQASPRPATTPQTSAPAVSAQPVATPTQTSPGLKATPKSTLKALPTVRDHTSDQLNDGKDEYVAREYDDQGETKVDAMGYLQGGRGYKIRTFRLPDRGEKLFMLATECARTLQYRDSYLLFNKNRSLYKIIASPKEKEELVAHDILPYSYRSRQIALVTARSMFRQFGSRVVKDGRRVRDDYWEAKARKQGFTEEDAAGEKRPGAARAREAAAAEALGNRHLQQYGNIVYAHDSSYANFQPPSLPPGIASIMPDMSTLEQYDARYRDVARPRQELAGPPYADITRTSSEAEMTSQAAHAADFSKNINNQARFRKGIVEDYWHRPHDPPVTTPQQQAAEPVVTTQALQSPGYDNVEPTTQSPISVPPQQTQQTPMNPPSFTNPQNPMQSPSRQTSMPHSMSSQYPASIPRHSSGLSQVTNYDSFQSMRQSQNQQQQSWGGPPPQPTQSPAMSNRMYNPPQSSPHIQQSQIPSPMQGGHSQSPHPQQQQQQMQPPQMFQQGMTNMGAQGLLQPGQGLRMGVAGGYMNMPQNVYQQMPGNYMQQHPGGHQGQMGGFQPPQQWQNY